MCIRDSRNLSLLTVCSKQVIPSAVNVMDIVNFNNGNKGIIILFLLHYIINISSIGLSTTEDAQDKVDREYN